MYMNERGMQDDSTRREHEQWEKSEAARVKAQKEKQAMEEAVGKTKRKDRASRPNYMSMTDIDFHRIHRKDFYADQERD
jgi:hypothetical protein